MQAEKLVELRQTAQYAASKQPWYQKSLSAAGVRADGIRSLDDWRKVPLTTRADVQKNFPDGLLPSGMPVAALVKKDEVRLVRSLGDVFGERLEFAVDRARVDAMRQAAISGNAFLKKLFAARAPRPAAYRTIPTAGVICIRDMPAKDLRVDTRVNPPLLRLVPPEDAANPTRQEVEKLFLEIDTHGTEWLEAQPTYLALATYVALDEGLEIPRVKAIVSSVRSFSRRHRQLLEEHWRCPVIGEWSLPEVGQFALYECAFKRLHANEGYAHVELYRQDGSNDPGQVGRLLVTGLKDRVPLLRYLSLDLAAAGDGSRCPCGAVNDIGTYCGSVHEMVVGDHGAVPVSRIDRALSSFDGIRQYHLRQEKDRSLTLSVAADPSADRARVSERAEEALRAQLGDGPGLEVRFERVQPHPITLEFPLAVSHALGKRNGTTPGA